MVETELVLQKGQRNAAERYAGAMQDTDEILECYRRIQMHLRRLAVSADDSSKTRRPSTDCAQLNADLNVWKIVDEQATVRST